MLFVILSDWSTLPIEFLVQRLSIILHTVDFVTIGTSR